MLKLPVADSVNGPYILVLDMTLAELEETFPTLPDLAMLPIIRTETIALRDFYDMVGRIGLCLGIAENGDTELLLPPGTLAYN